MKLAILFLTCCLSLAAQDLQFTDTATFSGGISFAASFEYNPATQTVLPGTLVYSESDPFGLGPFTLANGTSDGSAGWFNFESPAAWIQIGDEVGSALPWPSPGMYGQDTVLLCQSQTCLRDLNGAGYDVGNDTLVITDPPAPAETPEPSTWALLVCGGVLWGVVEFFKRR